MNNQKNFKNKNRVCKLFDSKTNYHNFNEKKCIRHEFL